ncbi:MULTISPECIES: hypothetical protein [Stenotrophomonas]|uniref:hypothetical protein n=1 Tax=Stenotrophomonas TaxID=40323 RepID=UPI00159F5B38|nr:MULTISPECIES: hypothetical protein [Stenotrophomonas]
MNSVHLNFDLYALAQPKSREDLVALAVEVISELDNIDSHLAAAFARCKASAAA